MVATYVGLIVEGMAWHSREETMIRYKASLSLLEKDKKCLRSIRCEYRYSYSLGRIEIFTGSY